MSIRLQSGEKLVRRLRPHPLVFWHIYLIWIYFLIIGFFFLAEEKTIVIRSVKFYVTGNLIWWEAVLFPAGIFAVLKRSWLLSFALSIPGFSAYILPGFTSAADQNQLLIVFGISGTFAAEIYRRRRRYYITSRRLIIESGYLSIKRRTLLYKRIDDVTIKQPLFGRIFNFGSIIPVKESAFFRRDRLGDVSFPMASGLPAGSGDDNVEDLAESRHQADFQLKGVSDPDEILELILSKMYEDQ